MADEHSDVQDPSPSTETLSTTSTESDGELTRLLEYVVTTFSDKVNIPPFSLEPYVQPASDESEQNDEIATVTPPLLNPPLVPVPLPGIMDTPEEYFSNILKLSREVQIIPPTFVTLIPDFLLPVLNRLGMTNEIGEDRLTRMFHTSGYFDANARLDHDHFILFDSDFKFLEAFKACIASSKMPAGTPDDLGRLGEFFRILEAGRQSGFKSSDFVNAFHALGANLTNADANSLEEYSKLDREDPQDFDRFLRKRRPPQDVQGRAVFLNRGQRLHRMMLFVSMYPRPKRNTPSSSHHAESGNDA